MLKNMIFAIDTYIKLDVKKYDFCNRYLYKPCDNYQLILAKGLIKK